MTNPFCPDTVKDGSLPPWEVAKAYAFHVLVKDVSEVLGRERREEGREGEGRGRAAQEREGKGEGEEERGGNERERGRQRICTG